MIFSGSRFWGYIAVSQIPFALVSITARIFTLSGVRYLRVIFFWSTIVLMILSVLFRTWIMKWGCFVWMSRIRTAVVGASTGFIDASMFFEESFSILIR